MPTEKIIAIVGGGSIATSFIAQLARQADTARSEVEQIVLFEKRSTLGSGEPYGDDMATNLLNTRADTMSVYPDDSGHFYRWLEEHQAAWRQRFPDVELSPSAFLPRSLFGLYLQQVFRDSAAACERAGITLAIVHDEVVDIEPAMGGYSLRTALGHRHAADAVVLTIGNLPATNYRHLDQYPNYFASPYPCRDVARAIAPGATVCVIGTGLSAVDAITSLAKRSAAAKIVCVSRSGRFPSVRSSAVARHKPNVLSRERIRAKAEAAGGKLDLEDIAEMLIEELAAADGSGAWVQEILNPRIGLNAHLSWEVECATGRERAWQTVLYSTNQSIDLMWHYLTAAAKERFIRYFRRTWLCYRVSFPLANAVRLKGLLDDDSLIALPGVRSIEYDNERRSFVVTTKDPHRGCEISVLADYVVNATGYSDDVTAARVPLVRNLLQRGLATPDPFGGIRVQFGDSRVIGSGGTQPGLVALGSLTTGTYFFTNAMDVNARLAGQALQGLLAQFANAAPAPDPEQVPLHEAVAYRKRAGRRTADLS